MANQINNTTNNMPHVTINMNDISSFSSPSPSSLQLGSQSTNHQMTILPYSKEEKNNEKSYSHNIIPSVYIQEGYKMNRREYEYKYGHDELNLITDMVTKKTRKSTKLANLFRSLNILVSIFIIIFACIIFVMSYSNVCNNETVSLASGSIIALKTFHEMFKLSSRGIYFKYVTIRLRTIMNSVREARIYLRTGKELIFFANHISNEINQLDLEMYRMTNGPESIRVDIDGNVSGASPHSPRLNNDKLTAINLRGLNNNNYSDQDSNV